MMQCVDLKDPFWFSECLYFKFILIKRFNMLKDLKPYYATLLFFPSYLWSRLVKGKYKKGSSHLSQILLGNMAAHIVCRQHHSLLHSLALKKEKHKKLSEF